MNQVIDYIDGKRIEYKRNGDELIIKCPYCGKKKLYINSVSGKYHCFVCEAVYPLSPYCKGHISGLKEIWGDVIPISSVSDKLNLPRENEPNFNRLVDRYHNEILCNGRALRYLLKRGITEESIKRFKLGFTRRYGQDWISIPSFEDGVAKLLKYRKLPPDENKELGKYIREKGSKSIIFNQDCLKTNETIYITEGEMDCISMIQAGYENVVGCTGGAGTLLPEHYDKLIMKDKIYLIFDPDEAGQNAAEKVWATRLGIDKCWNVKLPNGYDLNEFIFKWGKSGLERLLNEAEQFKVKGVISLDEALVNMYLKSQDSNEIEKYELPWSKLNKLLGGGLSKQHMIVVSGTPGVGKTSMAVQIAYHYAKKYSMPSLIFNMEMSEISLAAKVVQLDMDLTLDEVSYSDGMVYAEELGNLPIYFGYDSRVKPDVFYNTVKEARNRFGIEMVVFDNIQRLIRSGEESDMAKASGLFRDIALDMDLIFILISQPRKAGVGQNVDRVITGHDLKGSSAMFFDSDEIIILHRKRIYEKSGNETLDPKTDVYIEKSRYSSGGKLMLMMEGAKSRFVEI